MPAFNLDDERRRLSESGLSYQTRHDSAVASLRTYLYERTGAPSSFQLEARPMLTTAVGYEHRGDLANSYNKSVEEAEEDKVKERYKLENDGYEEVKARFFDLPLYATIMLASPSPDHPIPGYPGHNMMYFYHITPSIDGDVTKRTIKALAWVNHFTKEEQATLLNDLGPEEEVSATERSVLLSPVATYAGTNDTESFKMLWERVGKVYENAENKMKFKYPSFNVMNRYLLDGDAVWENRHHELSLMARNIAQRMISGESKEDLAYDWDIMLNYADQELLHEDVTDQLPSEIMIINPEEEEGLIFSRNKHLSYAPRETLTSCGVSAGMATYAPETRTAAILTGTYSVSGEGSGMERKLKCKKCPLCDAENIVATIANGKITCPECKESAPYNC